MLDVLVMGAGTAAVYLARFGAGFWAWTSAKAEQRQVSLTRNYPGFPCGLSGAELLTRLDDQAARYGANVRRDTVERLWRQAEASPPACKAGKLAAKAVILATCVVDRGATDALPFFPRRSMD